MSEESKSWYRMTRPLFNSGFEDDEFWAYGQDGFQEVLDSFIGSDILIYDKAIGTEPQQVRAIVQQKTSDVYNSTTVRQILCNIGILRCGQYVKHDGAFWLVSSLPDNNRIYEKAVLWKCKYSIRFVSPLTGEIVEYPVYSTNSTQYGTGEAGKTQMTVGEDQHLIYLPYNEETIMLDTQTRFLMDKNKVDPTAYRITRVDPISYAVGDERAEDGLIQWAVLEDQFNSKSATAVDSHSASNASGISYLVKGMEWNFCSTSAKVVFFSSAIIHTFSFHRLDLGSLSQFAQSVHLPGLRILSAHTKRQLHEHSLFGVGFHHSFQLLVELGFGANSQQFLNTFLIQEDRRGNFGVTQAEQLLTLCLVHDLNTGMIAHTISAGKHHVAGLDLSQNLLFGEEGKIPSFARNCDIALPRQTPEAQRPGAKVVYQNIIRFHNDSPLIEIRGGVCAPPRLRRHSGIKKRPLT